jgi:hypothetical protein
MLSQHDKQVRETAALLERLANRLAAASDAWTHRAASPVADPDDPAGPNQPGEGERHNPGPGDRRPGPEDGALPSWLVITDWHQAHALMSALAPWVEQVYLRWPEALLPACWALHPHAVEELWTLRCAWYDARTGECPSWLKWQDWHDRQRPSATRRLREALDGCSLLEHATPDRSAHPRLLGADTLPQAVTAWATPEHTGWPPVLSQVQLAEERQRHAERLAAQAEQTRAARDAEIAALRPPRRSLTD